MKYGLIVLGKKKPILFKTKKERDKVARYLKNRITYTTFNQRKR